MDVRIAVPLTVGTLALAGCGFGFWVGNMGMVLFFLGIAGFTAFPAFRLLQPDRPEQVPGPHPLIPILLQRDKIVVAPLGRLVVFLSACLVLAGLVVGFTQAA